MKVLKSNLTDDTTGWDECGILRTLRDQNPQATGYRHICHLIDDFVHDGPNKLDWQVVERHLAPPFESSRGHRGELEPRPEYCRELGGLLTVSTSVQGEIPTLYAADSHANLYYKFLKPTLGLDAPRLHLEDTPELRGWTHEDLQGFVQS